MTKRIIWKTKVDIFTGAMEGHSKYTLFFGKDSPFSQHHKCMFDLDGIRFCCTEQYMMYHKADVFKDQQIKEKVLQSTRPAEIKRLGRELKNFDILIWMKCAVDIVKRGNKAKFSQNPQLMKHLFDTYPRQLVEASPSDTRWGIGLAAYNPAARDERLWRGRNLLGKLLTNLRDELMLETNKIKEVTMPTLDSDQSNVEKLLLEQDSNGRFKFFWKPDSPYHDDHKCNFTVDAVSFISMRQYISYSKVVLFNGVNMAKTALKKQMGSYRYGEVRGFDSSVWQSSKCDIYRKGIKAKFTQNPHLSSKLASTFPKILLRPSKFEREKFTSNPDHFNCEEYKNDHWSEFILMDFRDELLKETNGEAHSWRKVAESRNFKRTQSSSKICGSNRYNLAPSTSGRTTANRYNLAPSTSGSNRKTHHYKSYSKTAKRKRDNSNDGGPTNYKIMKQK